MSRSKKKNPFTSIVAGRSGRSEKKDKQSWHRALRREIKKLLKLGSEELPDIKEVSNPWMMSKDGKQYLDKHKFEKDLRK